MPDIGKENRTLYVRTRDEWRSWLEDNHDSIKVIWLLYYKKHTCRERIPYDDAVEEALCFGWIDSIVKRIDEISYCQKFTPRNPGSRWSESNIKRAMEMIEQGKMTPAGMKFYQEVLDNPDLQLKSNENSRDLKLPDDLKERLNKRPDAMQFFSECSRSYKNNCIRWVEAAKKAETRQRRIKEVTDKSNKKEKIGLK